MDRPERNHRTGNPEAEVCYRAARAYEVIGRTYFQEVRGEGREPVWRPIRPEEPLMVFAAGVNLAFGLELYLKSLLLCVGRGAMRTHDLKSLYEQVPLLDRDDLERLYEEQTHGKELRLTWVTISSPGHDPRKDKREFKRECGLAGILETARRSFEMWRYVHDDLPSPDSSEGRSFLCDYEGMLVASEVLREYIPGRSKVAWPGLS